MGVDIRREGWGRGEGGEKGGKKGGGEEEKKEGKGEEGESCTSQ